MIREGLDDLPPFTSAGVRFLLAAVVMAMLAPWLAPREGGTRPTLRLVAAMGVLNFALSYGVVYWAECSLPSGLVALLWAIYPMLMAAMGHVWLRGERLRGRQWIGFLGGFAGVGLLLGTDLPDIGGGAVTAGLVLLVSPLAVAFGTVIIKREGRGVCSVLLNRDAMALGAALLLMVALFTERDAPAAWTPRAVGSIVYLAIAGTVVTFGLYHWVLRFAPAHQLALIAYVTPVLALALGVALRNEPVGPNTLVAGLLILAGVTGVLAGGAPRKPPSIPDGAGNSQSGSEPADGVL